MTENISLVENFVSYVPVKYDCTVWWTHNDVFDVQCMLTLMWFISESNLLEWIIKSQDFREKIVEKKNQKLLRIIKINFVLILLMQILQKKIEIVWQQKYSIWTRFNLFKMHLLSRWKDLSWFMKNILDFTRNFQWFLK